MIATKTTFVDRLHELAHAVSTGKLTPMLDAYDHIRKHPDRKHFIRELQKNPGTRHAIGAIIHFHLFKRHPRAFLSQWFETLPDHLR